MSITFSTALLPTVPSPSPDQLHHAVTLLAKMFPSPKFDKLVGVATRCTLWTLPLRLRDRDDVVEPIALWLALVWLIDDKFDQERSTLTQYHYDLVKDIVEQTVESSKINDPFFKLIAVGFERYYSLIVRSFATEKITEWFMKYMETIFDSTSTSFTIKWYEQWRLKSGAMMCVVWHLVHHMDDPTQDDLSCFYIASLYISYQNDLLSYERDVVDQTPNLVHIIPGNTKEEKYHAAISHLNAMNTEMNNEVAQCVLHGCYNWALTEPRYALGRASLEAILL